MYLLLKAKRILLKSSGPLKKKNKRSSVDDPLSLDLVENFFEKAWNLYPKKAGKTKILKDQKKKLFKLGDEFIRCVERYKSDPELKINSGWKEVLDGSTFFNERYEEWRDKNYEEHKQTTVKTASERKKERIFKLLGK